MKKLFTGVKAYQYAIAQTNVISHKLTCYSAK